MRTIFFQGSLYQFIVGNDVTTVLVKDVNTHLQCTNQHILRCISLMNLYENCNLS